MACALPQGVKLLSYLYNEAQNNCSNENYPVLLSLLKTSCEPYTRSVTNGNVPIAALFLLQGLSVFASSFLTQVCVRLGVQWRVSGCLRRVHDPGQ